MPISQIPCVPSFTDKSLPPDLGRSQWLQSRNNIKYFILVRVVTKKKNQGRVVEFPSNYK